MTKRYSKADWDELMEAFVAMQREGDRSVLDDEVEMSDGNWKGVGDLTLADMKLLRAHLVTQREFELRGQLDWG